MECDLGPSLLLAGVVVDAVVVGSVAHLMIAKGAQPVMQGWCWAAPWVSLRSSAWWR